MVIYQTKSGALELRGDLEKETIWATQSQIAEVFNTERSVITKHIANVFMSGEVDKKRNVQKMHIANSDKQVTIYSLDIILAVGYRTNSAKAIEFRQWATKTLREHITKGFTINKRRIGKNYSTFMKAVADVQSFSFAWFLHKSGVKGSRNINPVALTTLTLLIAEGDAKKKDQMVALVTYMLR